MFSTFFGDLGYFFTALSLVSAFVSSISFISFYYTIDIGEQKTWEKMGRIAFKTHTTAVLGIMATLFYLIYTHQYQYHYVWSHSSSELPVHFMIACFWEGQEGSFLLWMAWHAILGAWMLRKPNEWTNIVLGIVASVQIILASMILGIQIPAWLALTFWISGLIACITFAFYRFKKGMLGLSGQMAAFLGLGFLYVLIVSGYAPIKVGSSPFVLLRDVMKDAPVFAQNKDFIPSNGTGLNPLLQNYWMVIHPPTLFLGFASTLFPFAFVVAGLLLGKGKEWVQPAMPWNIFAVMILGLGIILGGYWAYETLNFGGYWNWDPVENASLVPWITGVAGLHMLISWRQGKTYLRLAASLILATFILVLYSTFLTRSGVLGEASVHTFTDLGLSGQLLLLLFVYMGGIVILAYNRWHTMPTAVAPTWLNRDFFLFLGALVLIASALQITFATSLPVINKILGTHLAPPVNTQFYYYKWQVWFGILIAVLSGVGQFLYWFKVEKKTFSRALMRPFFLSLFLSSMIMMSIFYYNWEFVYHKTLAETLEVASAKGWFNTIWAFFSIGLLAIADDFLLLFSIFAIIANTDVLIQLLRKSKLHRKNAGGALAHIGFGLMLIGILFSSGYEWIVSVNLTPQELANFPSSAQNDNILLGRTSPKFARGYQVSYLGKLQASLPITGLRKVVQDEHMVKVQFEDKTGLSWALEFPVDFFESPDSTSHTAANRKPEIDLTKLQAFIEHNIDILQPKLINNRTRYGLEFITLADTLQKFTLYPEAEINEGMGLIAHPDRKISWNKDLYVHVTSVPDDDKDGSPMMEYSGKFTIGDTLSMSRAKVHIESLLKVEDVPEFKEKYEIVARIQLKVFSAGMVKVVKPTLFVSKKGELSVEPVNIPELGMQFAFTGVDPKEGKILIAAREQDWSKDRITIKAIAKPYINFLWIGTFVLTFGFGVALTRRIKEWNRRAA